MTKIPVVSDNNLLKSNGNKPIRSTDLKPIKYQTRPNQSITLKTETVPEF